MSETLKYLCLGVALTLLVVLGFARSSKCESTQAAPAADGSAEDCEQGSGGKACPVNPVEGDVATARCRNEAGDGAIIQAAVSTGLTTHIIGPCDLDASVVMTTPGQLIHGDGRTVTVLRISSQFAKGALVFATGEPGPTIRDIGLSFVQPNVSERSHLAAYPPAIDARNTPRFRLKGVRVTGAMVGIDMRGQSGGAIIDDLEESAFEVGIWADGSFDTVTIDKWHFWPFDVQGHGCGTTRGDGQCAIWNAANDECAPQSTSGVLGPIGGLFGRVDDLKISNGLTLSGQGLCFVGGSIARGSVSAEISNFAFDTFGGVSMNTPAVPGEPEGQVSIVSSYFSLIDGGYTGIKLSAGSLQCSACRIQGGKRGDKAMISQAGGNLTIDAMYADMGAADNYLIKADSAGVIIVNGLQLKSSATSPSVPKISIGESGHGPVAIISGVVPLAPITTGILIRIGSDDYHRVIGNSLNSGWVNSCPILAARAIYADNGTTSAATCN